MIFFEIVNRFLGQQSRRMHRTMDISYFCHTAQAAYRKT